MSPDSSHHHPSSVRPTKPHTGPYTRRRPFAIQTGPFFDDEEELIWEELTCNDPDDRTDTEDDETEEGLGTYQRQEEEPHMLLGGSPYGRRITEDDLASSENGNNNEYNDEFNDYDTEVDYACHHHYSSAEPVPFSRYMTDRWLPSPSPGLSSSLVECSSYLTDHELIGTIITVPLPDPNGEYVGSFEDIRDQRISLEASC